MRIIQNAIPVLILLILAFYFYSIYDQLPDVVISAVVFLPVVLFFLVTGLSIHFNRSPIFFYSLLIALANMVLGLELISTFLGFSLFSISIPLLVLVLSLMPERGIFNANAVPAHAVLLVTLFVTLIFSLMSPEWMRYLLLTDWFPAEYFDWTPQSQTVLLIFVLVFLVMLVLSFMRPSPHMFAALGVMILLMAQLHSGATSRGLNIYSSVALLMCLYAIMQESWRMAYLDELTDLPARRALREKLQTLSGVYSIAMIDVDHFKQFNDRYGHDTGDAVLRMIAGRLQKVTGGGAAYRYGGEEFCIVFNGRDVADAKSHLETLRQTIASSLFVINRMSRRKHDNKAPKKNNKSVTITVSIGVADSSMNADSPWDILKSADKALYQAKQAGRNRVSVS